MVGTLADHKMRVYRLLSPDMPDTATLGELEHQYYKSHLPISRITGQFDDDAYRYYHDRLISNGTFTSAQADKLTIQDLMYRSMGQLTGNMPGTLSDREYAFFSTYNGDDPGPGLPTRPEASNSQLSSANNGTTTTCVQTVNAGVNGDVLVLSVSYLSGTGTITTPDGWTLLFSYTDGANITRAVFVFAITTATPRPGSVIITVSTAGKILTSLLRVAANSPNGSQSALPILGTTSNPAAGTANLPIPLQTITQNFSLVVALALSDYNNSVGLSARGGYTNIGAVGTGAYVFPRPLHAAGLQSADIGNLPAGSFLQESIMPLYPVNIVPLIFAPYNI